MQDGTGIPLNQSTLVLNRSWAVVNVTTVRRAICLLYRGHARAVAPETYESHDFDSWIRVPPNGFACLRTVSLRLRKPEIIVLKHYDSMPAKDVPFSRRNIYRRDNYTCQYCHRRFRVEELTIDHVLPRSLGGRTSWDNCVLACTGCNSRKGDRTPEKAGMTLNKAPRRPHWTPELAMQRGTRPAAWDNFLPRN